jgi:hypothetical protein
MAFFNILWKSGILLITLAKISFSNHPVQSRSGKGKTTHPSPVAGSHPTVLFQLAPGIMPAFANLNPVWKFVPLQPLVPPNVTSVKKLLPLAYNHGLIKPIVGFFALRRASFNSATRAAQTGEAAEVPPEGRIRPPVKIWKKI